MHMQPMTSKELEYIVDSMSNEDLLIKHNAAVAASIKLPAASQLCSEMVSIHRRHYDLLLQSLYQHQEAAPTQPQ
ncbi:hypothetical protein WMW72_11065 [Paenibacillus filicis]|uniref:Spore coat protein n=1 Tax=Paenibacillus filicis TaxID=669464 RepID=A0ABU9DK28_9BACL